MILKRKLPENISLSDLIYFENELQREISQGTIEKKENVIVTSSGSQITYRISTKDLIKGKGNVPVLINTSKWLHGYFHWLTQVLPLFERLKKCPDLYEMDCIHYALPKSFLKFKFIEKSFEFFPQVEPVVLTKWSRKKYRKAYILKTNTPSGNYIPSELLSLRDHLIRTVNLHGVKANRRVFVSRKKSKRRKLINEPAINLLLKRHNFEIIYPEDHSWPEQIQIFSEASHMIGIHGAALTNMMFMKTGTSILEIRAGNDKTNNCFFSLANALEVKYYYFLASTHQTYDDRLGDFVIDIDSFAKTLQDFSNEDIIR